MKTQVFGSTEVRKLVEMEQFAVECNWLLSNLTPEILAEHRQWLGPKLVDPNSNQVYIAFHSYVIQTPSLNILVDTCNGNDKQRPSMPAWTNLKTPYLDRMKAMGLSPDDIDIVMCTHLHTDHVGWNTRLENGRWVPTFRNARYLMSRGEFEFFDKLHKSNPPQPVNRGSWIDSVLPVVEARQAVFVDPGAPIDADLGDHIRLESAIGHTAGNVNIILNGGGRRACMSGDVFHHPIQFARPDLMNPADYNSEMAIAVRRRMIDSYADSDMMILAAHFTDPTAGHIVRHGDGFRFKFENQ
ncbi:MAG TPA: MBL fold metallo-hydrolase [Stellaceae bacterium]|nr:MBL fold metallo-hydrolase [Stellaceae bacterium]